MSNIFFEKFKIFFLEEGEFFLALFFIQMIYNIFVFRICYRKFNGHFFEKIINSLLFLLIMNIIFGIFIYYLPIIKYFTLFIIIFPIFIEANLYFEYKIFISGDIFTLLFETNNNETREFLKEIFTFKLLKNILLVIFYFFLIPITISRILYVYLNTFSFEKNLIVDYTIIFLLLFVGIYFFLSKKWEKRLVYYTFFRIYKEFLIAKEANKKTLSALEIQKELEEKIEDLDLKNKEIDNLIFIIGESASRNYLEIYNSYASYLKNSPNMLKRKEKGNLFVFNDVVSPYSMTHLSIPNLLTFKNYESNKEWYEHKNIVSILKKAGYTTYWISNQAKDEILSQIFSSISDKKFFTEEFIEKHFFEKNINKEIFFKKNGENYAYDEGLIDEGFKIIGNEKKKAIFIHLYGSHFKYSNRYPQKWDIDKEKDIKRDLPKKNKKIIAEYSNSLRYTDYVLEKILSNFENEKSLFIYLSDHAEEFWESRNIRGHLSDNGSKYMIEIPFFIMISEKLQKIYPNLIESCKNSLNKPYMTDDVIHTLLGILGIKIDEYEQERDLLSNNFNEKRKRIYLEKDYDTFWKNQFENKK